MNNFRSFLKFCNILIPKNSKQIVFRSAPDFSDSSIAVYNALKANPRFKDFRMVWLTTSNIREYQGAKCYQYKSLLALLSFFRAKYTFSTHGIYGGLATKKQIKVELWHGMPLKSLAAYSANSNLAINFDKDMYDFTYLFATSPFFKNIMAKCFKMSEDAVHVLGLPRNDMIMHPDDSLVKLNIGTARKSICWLPTYRNPIDVQINNRVVEQGKNYEFGIPLINSGNINLLDSCLHDADVNLIIKIHSMQKFDKTKIPASSYIHIITDEDLCKNDVQLYKILACSNALITDYSSVYIDYLATDKPMAFVVDDIDEYSSDRGFVFENPMDYMPGMKVKTLKDLMEFIAKISQNVDDFKQARSEARKTLNIFTDDKNTQRVIDFVFGNERLV